jgi:hypothetical protein
MQAKEHSRAAFCGPLEVGMYRIGWRYRILDKGYRDAVHAIIDVLPFLVPA